ncbi:MAG TPA: hypothetical protein VFX37_10315, partial [Pseudolabrys sp.]|nr:hypothetical protein [Pseudolabrys sp.]
DARPDIFLAVRGPILSPSRTVDVSALAGWLTLRSVERQAKKLEAIQSTPSAPVEASQPPAIEPSAPTIEMAPATQKPAPLHAAPALPPRRNMPAAVAEKRAPEHTPAKKRVAPALPPPLVIRPAPGVAPEFSIISPN